MACYKRRYWRRQRWELQKAGQSIVEERDKCPVPVTLELADFRSVSGAKTMAATWSDTNIKAWLPRSNLHFPEVYLPRE